MDTSAWIARAGEQLKKLGTEKIIDSGIVPERGNKFFPVIGYPPLTMFSDMDQDVLFADFSSRPQRPLLGYVHIPFCPSRCTFCHWITKTKSKKAEVDVYLDYLEREMALYKQGMSLSQIPVQSILVGGGTPTYLDAPQMERFLNAYTTHFDLSECTQFSVEAEPNTLLGKEGREKLAIMKDYGVHRISLGVQSFNDDVLAYMGRTHTHADTLASIDACHQAGIDRVMIDLIYGYPGQTLQDWTNNMLEAVQLDIDGFQLYRLRIRQHGDRKGNIILQHEKRPERFATADDVFLMKQLGILISEEHGFNEHQTRVFTKDPEHVSHYLRDWAGRLADVAGVGVSAWSNLRGVFSLNVGDQDLQSYYDYIDAGKVAVNRGKIRTRDDELRRNFILPLKNLSVNKAEYQSLSGIAIGDAFPNEIAWMKQLDLLEEDAECLRLTRLGRFFADEVATQFFNPDFLPFPEVARAPQLKRASG